MSRPYDTADNKTRGITSKRKLLEKFSIRLLRELAELYGLNCKGTSKSSLIDCIMARGNFRKKFILDLLEAEGDTIREKLRNSFYNKYVQERNAFLEEFYETVADHIARGVLF